AESPPKVAAPAVAAAPPSRAKADEGRMANLRKEPVAKKAVPTPPPADNDLAADDVRAYDNRTGTVSVGKKEEAAEGGGNAGTLARGGGGRQTGTGGPPPAPPAGAVQSAVNEPAANDELRDKAKAAEQKPRPAPQEHAQAPSAPAA